MNDVLINMFLKGILNKFDIIYYSTTSTTQNEFLLNDVNGIKQAILLVNKGLGYIKIIKGGS